MNRSQLEQFKILAECENMRLTSEQLFITEPTLSRNLKELEREVGAALFDRERKHIRLNSYGKIFYEHVCRMGNELNSALAEIEEEKRRTLQQYNIGCFSYAFQNFVMPAIAKHHPDCMFRCVLAEESELTGKLNDGEYDAIIISSYAVTDKLPSLKLYDEHAIVAVSEEDELAFQLKVSSEDLTEREVLLPQDTPGCTEWFERIINDAEADIKIKPLPMKNYLANKDHAGVVHLTTDMIEKYAPPLAGRKWLPLEATGAERQVHLCWLKEREREISGLAGMFREYYDNSTFDNSFLAYFLFPGNTSNLELTKEADR